MKEEELTTEELEQVVLQCAVSHHQQKLVRTVILLDRAHNRADSIRRDIRLLKQCREVDVKPLLEELDGHLAFQVGEIRFYRNVASNIGLSVLFEDGAGGYDNLSYLYRGTFRSWRLGHYNRLQKLGSRRSKLQEFAFQLLKREITEGRYP